MNAMPGGMRLPSEAPAAIEPSTSRSSYLRRRNEGSATVAMVAAVDTDEPDTAENSAEAPTLVCSRPPGSRPSHSAIAPYILLSIPLYILLGEILVRSGATDKMYGAIALW